MDKGSIKSALQSAKAAIEEALSACGDEGYEEEESEEMESSAEEASSSDKEMRRGAIAAKIKKSLYNE